jgi:hypothetical protein
MKNILIGLSLSIFAITGTLAQDVKTGETQQLKDPTSLLQDKIRTQQKTIDSLVLIVMGQEKNESIIKDLDEKTQLNEDEVTIGKLVIRLEQTIFKTNSTSGTKELYKFFLPRFSANLVSIDREGKGSIAIINHENMKDHYANLIEKEDAYYKIVNIDFLDTEIVSEVFNMAYKTLIEYYEGDKHISNQTILTTLTGRLNNKEWKIGNYARTSIEYYPEER